MNRSKSVLVEVLGSAARTSPAAAALIQEAHIPPGADPGLAHGCSHARRSLGGPAALLHDLWVALLLERPVEPYSTESAFLVRPVTIRRSGAAHPVGAFGQLRAAVLVFNAEALAGAAVEALAAV